MSLFIKALALVAAFAAAAPAQAHEGHDHGPPVPETQTIAAPRAEAQSDDFELVAIARDGALTIFLDRFRSNEPVIGAAIEMETPEGPRAAEAIDDRYRIDAPWTSQAGTHELLFTIVEGATADVLIATLVVPEPEAAPAASGGLPAFLAAILAEARARLGAADRALLGVAGVAFVGGALISTAMLGRRRRLAAVGLLALGAATVIASYASAEPAGTPQGAGQGATTIVRDVARRLPDGAVFMPKQSQRLLQVRTIFSEKARHARSVELAGRVIADPNASGFVQAAVSGRLSAPAKGFPRLGAPVQKGDVLAYVTPPLSAAETISQQQRRSELDQQIALIQQRIGRFEKLLASGAVARVQLEEARMELESLRERRAGLEQRNHEPEALVAPVSGVVAASSAVAGQIADANAVVFQIVDPRRLWVEALTLQPLGELEQAQARGSDGSAHALRYMGSGFADKSQFAPVHFALPEDAGARLRVGQLVSVFALTRDADEGIAVPRRSVLTGPNGQSVVYEHARAERFELREVRLAPLDAERVLILAGVAPGRRIVVQGAELLNQVR